MILPQKPTPGYAIPSRQERRRLERAADKLFAKLHGLPVRAPAHLAPKDTIIIVTPKVHFGFRRTELAYGLRLACARIADEDLDELLACIEADPHDDGAHYPVLVAIDGFACASWIQSFPMSKGGDA
jgi:hypothetical protein